MVADSDAGRVCVPYTRPLALIQRLLLLQGRVGMAGSPPAKVFTASRLRNEYPQDVTAAFLFSQLHQVYSFELK